ncbi:molecular chaperone HtpG [Malonomonas rubra DSM 5091]|uniref:Chaperone protein HtpG n=1 Tax=Malonomonas rubra DSM 5091 TaxID=1122189 RepID=A0A1M6DA07_MALRU|nr:molecular chaperone HtpG [Malonomonas rubra]SHI69950.1 molecular chaperone HtpG [Malonomonas rubra DSM 5091]
MSEKLQKEEGSISIHTENIFPIIKKWLYSDKDIFLRELVSNAVDAIHKLQNINLMEGLKLTDEYQVDIKIDKDAGTLTVIDNGLGMTADEVRKYINQVAFSSAEDFIEKFKGLEDKNEIIGHFGLGFYSSFMVADKVEIRSLSYQQDAEAVHWTCAGTTSYELEASDKSERGTEIILHLNDEEKEFLEKDRVSEVLKKFCNFLPVSISLEGEEVNDKNPLWTKSAGEVTDEEYLEFYRKLYPMSQDPLFWIHLNIDFPFNLKGIIYFPRLTNEFDVTKSHIKLFCNQVFVSDNTPELIPEFLTPLQGCLDAPDLPLNVSRSYLQNEPQVRKIREVISGRVASKVVELAKKDREIFVPIWEDIHTFVKYGMMREDKFYDKVKDQVIYRSTGDEKYTTLPDYLERAKEKHENKVYYANDEGVQATYLKMFKAQGMEALILDAMIDNHFIQFLESKNSDLKFERVDSDVTENLIEEKDESKEIVDADNKSRKDRIEETFKAELDIKGLTIRIETLKDNTVPGVILLNEQQRRFKEMTSMMGQGEMPDMFADHTLMVNAASPAVEKVLSLQDAGDKETAGLLMQQIYDLAMLSHQAISKERMADFLDRSGKLLGMI